MEYLKVKELAQKFLLAQTSEQEESELKSVLINPTFELDEELKEVADMLRFFENEKQELNLDDAFDQRIMAKIESDSDTKVIPIARKSWYWAAAATAVLVMGLSWILQNQSVNQLADATEEDPMQAYLETKKALMFMSVQLNEGISYVEEIKEFDRAKEQIQRPN